MRRRTVLALLYPPPRPYPRLDGLADRAAFRLWFTWLAEVLCFTGPHRAVTDCSALLRFAYREALRRHDGAWLAETGLPELPPFPEIGRLPASPGPGPAWFLTPGGFRQFADARHLMHFNARRLARDTAPCRPGDLLFSRQLEDWLPYHSMVFAGQGHFDRRGSVVVYHTGPAGGGAGEMRRVLLSDLVRHPQPRWRPLPGNPNFLGAFRWNLLREDI